MINCGIYIFSPKIYTLIDQVTAHLKSDPDMDPHFLRLEHDLIMKISGQKHIYVYETKDFWLQVKAAGVVVKANEFTLALLRQKDPSKLAKSGDGKTAPLIVGDVLIDPTAKVHPSAKLGPNVAIGPNVIIGAGVRLAHSILLDNSEVKDHACVLHSILGWSSSVGRWARLEGVPDFVNADVRSAGITILGTGVTVAAEIVVRSSIVLPHKELGSSVNNQIIL